MKRIIIPVAAVISLLGTSCNGNGSGDDPVKTFGIKAANYAAQNQIDSLKLIYPTLNADSVALNYIADSIKIAETGQPGIYTITLTKDASLSVKQAEDGTLTVTGSHGIIGLTPSQEKLAKGTGMITPELSDNEIAERLKDKDFVKFIENKAVQYVAKNFKRGKQTTIKDIEYMMDTGIIRFNVDNNLDVPMQGSDYTFNVVMEDLRTGQTWTNKQQGKDVPAGGSVYYDVEGSGYTGPSRTYVNTTLSNQAILEKYYTPTGKEYDEYLASKK